MAIITFSLSHYTLCILIYVWGQFTIITSCKPLESRQIKLFKKHKGLSDLMTGENRHLILISVGLMFTESYYIYVGKTRKTFFNFCSSIITHFSDISEKAKKKRKEKKSCPVAERHFEHWAPLSVSEQSWSCHPQSHTRLIMIMHFFTPLSS